MACVDELFIGDTGTSIEFLFKECDDTDPDNPVEVLVDISSASAMQIVFLKPDEAGTKLVKTNPDVKFLTDGTDSLIHYLTIVTDLDVAGPWQAQAKITMPTGAWYSSKISFQVKEAL